MAPKYKLTYFDLMARGESIRYLFAYGGVKYEDHRISPSDWPNVKSSTPYGKVPVLEVDGKIVTQSGSICRYLARQFDLLGSNEWQTLKIDSTAETITDLRFAMVMALKSDEATKAQKIETFNKETLPLYLRKFEAQVKENGGYFVDEKFSWADLHFGAVMDSITAALGKDVIADYPNLKSVVEKVWSLPSIKSWRAERRKTPM